MKEQHTQHNRFAVYSWVVVAFNILVVLWGAYVRATGSGAGCGNHWPLCNGTVIPREPAIETLVEFSHRITSGIALLMVVVQVVWVQRAFPRGHLARFGAWLSFVLMIIEALIGMLLVRFDLVVDNISVARGVALALHLFNTLLLLGALTITAHWAGGGQAIAFRERGSLALALLVGLIGTAIVGSSGAITALGDTLLIQGTLPGGVSQPLHDSSHILVRMRTIHPALAIIVGLYSLLLGQMVLKQRPTPTIRRLAIALGTLFLLQFLVGALNITLKAPVAMQLFHLLMADVVWIVLVLLSVESLAVPSEQAAPLVQLSRSGRIELPH